MEDQVITKDLKLYHCKILSSHNTLITGNALKGGELSIGILVLQLVLLYNMPNSVEFDISKILNNDLKINHHTKRKNLYIYDFLLRKNKATQRFNIDYNYMTELVYINMIIL